MPAASTAASLRRVWGWRTAVLLLLVVALRRTRDGSQSRGGSVRPGRRFQERGALMAATETGVETYRNFIGGEWVDPAEGQTEEVINPATGEAIAQAPLSTAPDVDKAV